MARKRVSALVASMLGAMVLTGALIHWMAAVADASVGVPPPAYQDISAGAVAGQWLEPGQVAALSACEDGVFTDTGAVWRICMPTGWAAGGDLVVYAHGYMAPDREIEIPEEQLSLPGSPWTIDQIVNAMGYAFATTSYRVNGLAVRPAISDLLDVVNLFTATKGMPMHVILAGVSEGGLITTLSVEEHPEVYSGGLAMCGPYGDFQGQVNHFGDFRVVFDYFFPELMPGDPLSISTDLMDNWSTHYTTTVEPEIISPTNGSLVDQLLAVTDVSPYQFDPPTSTNSIERLLWYNVFATNDGVAKLGGQPFDNQDRTYTESNDDATLNQMVERITATQAALDEIEAHYQTTGRLSVPLVTLHTTGDPVVPYWHATEYVSKTLATGAGALHENFRVDRHGHCAFESAEVLEAFTKLVAMIDAQTELIFLPVVFKAY